jgi:hypothetical protein
MHLHIQYADGHSEKMLEAELLPLLDPAPLLQAVADGCLDLRQSKQHIVELVTESKNREMAMAEPAIKKRFQNGTHENSSSDRVAIVFASKSAKAKMKRVTRQIPHTEEPRLHSTRGASATIPIQVRTATDKEMGRGAFATRGLAAGEFVGFYDGHVYLQRDFDQMDTAAAGTPLENTSVDLSASSTAVRGLMDTTPVELVSGLMTSGCNYAFNLGDGLLLDGR